MGSPILLKKGETAMTTNSPAPLLIALPKGRLAEKSLDLLSSAGLSIPDGETGRKLILESQDGRINYVLAKPWDVPTFVEYGAADMGICGLDVLRESGRDVYEPLLLPYGFCRLAVAGPVDRPNTPMRYESQPRVATKFPRLTAQFFQQRGINAEIIALRGSVELAPLTSLADLIVDLVETGDTLRANGLAELRTILDVQAVLIVNRAAYRTKAQQVRGVIDALRGVIG